MGKRTIESIKLSILFPLLDSYRNKPNEQTLIYCSSPRRARKLAREYWRYLIRKGVEQKYNLPLVEWMEKNISKDWSLTKSLPYGIAVHDASLQKHIGTSIIKYFNDGILDFVFCTSTIIEGVNTSAKNVILFDGCKGRKEIDYFDYSNIKGRSGRLMEHYVGTIVNLVPIPEKKTIMIDIPLYEQDEKTLTDEILINIRQSDVKPQVMNRYIKLHEEIDPELLGIIKRNGTDVNGQINIYNTLNHDIHTENFTNISWSQYPKWNNLFYILKLAENNTFKLDNKNAVSSVKQLVYFINIYKTKGSILALAKSIYNEKSTFNKDKDLEKRQCCLDEAIEQAFHIYRLWFQYNIPKALRVIDSIQRYICERNDLRAGSYTFFAQQLENDFIRENLSILMEFGIPSDTVRRLSPFIPVDLDEDAVVKYIKENKDELYKNLIQYEKDRLNLCL